MLQADAIIGLDRKCATKASLGVWYAGSVLAVGMPWYEDFGVKSVIWGV